MHPDNDPHQEPYVMTPEEEFWTLVNGYAEETHGKRDGHRSGDALRGWFKDNYFASTVFAERDALARELAELRRAVAEYLIRTDSLAKHDGSGAIDYVRARDHARAEVERLLEGGEG